MIKTINESDILVLTPFRAQRALIRQFLKNAGYKKVNVSTTHRAQGGERHTVIFDPSHGNNNFLKVEKNEDAERLVNVALSRAKARLIILLSNGDCKNKLFKEVLNIINNKGKR